MVRHFQRLPPRAVLYKYIIFIVIDIVVAHVSRVLADV